LAVVKDDWMGRVKEAMAAAGVTGPQANAEGAAPAGFAVRLSNRGPINFVRRGSAIPA